MLSIWQMMRRGCRMMSEASAALKEFVAYKAAHPCSDEDAARFSDGDEYCQVR